MTLKTTDHGSSWHQTYGYKSGDNGWINNGYVNTAVVDMLLDKNNIFILDPDIGLQISTDNGSSLENFSSDKYLSGATSIIMDKDNYYALYGSSNSGGLFKATKQDPFKWKLTEDFKGNFSDYTTMISAQNGSTNKIFITFWSAKGGVFSSSTSRQFQKEQNFKQSRATFIYQDPNNSNYLYAGFSYNEGGGLYRSTDFGETWNQIDSKDNGSDVHTVVVKPGNSDLIIKGVRGYSTPGKGGAYRSTDFGRHWKRIDETIKIPFELSGNSQQRWVKSLCYTIDGKLVMAFTNDSDAYWFPGIYISANDGSTWEKLDTNGISGRVAKVIPDSHDPNILWICSDGTGGVRYRIN